MEGDERGRRNVRNEMRGNEWRREKMSAESRNKFGREEKRRVARKRMRL